MRTRAVSVCLLALASLVVLTAAAEAETRTLKLYFTHTGERATITFKRNGRYDQEGLRKLNRFLRDHRRGESIRMDPQLFDIVWEAYQEVGARDYIHVVSAYRSQATNAMLRRTRGGQARKSQHTLGKAMDFFIPGVSARKLREVGFRLQGGGVGYYPRSASPYVHFDTGNVRAWPRMSRAELRRLFPNGGTAHLPSDGSPLPGYEQAVAAYQARKARGQATVNRGSITRGGSGGSGGGSGNLLAALFGGGRDAEEDEAQSAAPARSTSRPAAPAAQPETPGTLLAALPTSRMPLPTAAPRANRSGGVPVAITPQVPVQIEAAPEPAPTPTPLPQTPADVQVATVPEYTPPIPATRPAVLIARVEPVEEDRRSAAEIEAALAAAGSDAAAIATAANADAGQDNAARRQEIVAALQDRGNPADPLAFALPIPQDAPERPSQDADLPATIVAYAPPTTSELPAPAPSTNDAVVKAARLPIPAQRAAEQAQADPTLTASLADEQVFTTPKAPRPRPKDIGAPTQADSRLAAVPVPGPTPRLGDHMTTPVLLASADVAEGRPDFMMNAQRIAPATVYTQGFAPTTPPPDPSRFSGNAVTFLAVARFEGGTVGGDGQPLQIQVPATN